MFWTWWARSALILRGQTRTSLQTRFRAANGFARLSGVVGLSDLAGVSGLVGLCDLARWVRDDRSRSSLSGLSDFIWDSASAFSITSFATICRDQQCMTLVTIVTSLQRRRVINCWPTLPPLALSWRSWPSPPRRMLATGLLSLCPASPGSTSSQNFENRSGGLVVDYLSDNYWATVELSKERMGCFSPENRQRCCQNPLFGKPPSHLLSPPLRPTSRTVGADSCLGKK